MVPQELSQPYASLEVVDVRLNQRRGAALSHRERGVADGGRALKI